MAEFELEITSEQIQKLSDQSVNFYLHLGKNAESIASIYRVPLARVEKIVARLNANQEREEARAQARLRQALGSRPCPPEALLDMPGLFAPAPGLLDWARETFISEGSPLYNPEHDHLAYASVAFLWTSAPYKKHGRAVAGLCEMPTVQGNAWVRARMDNQLFDWFEDVPKFLITLSAPIAAALDDASFCALVEHELYHAGQAKDDFGGPRFNLQTGEAVLTMRGHDFEGFVGITRRYGVGAAEGGVAALVKAAGQTPSVAPAAIAQACGNCLK